MKVWEVQPLAKLSAGDAELADGNAIDAGRSLKAMPLNCERDRGLLQSYRTGLENRATDQAIHERIEHGHIEPQKRNRLADLTRYATAMDRALDAASTMTPGAIAERARQERATASGQWHDINALESGMSGGKGASKDQFDRWQDQDASARAWDRVSRHAEREDRERFEATLRPVTPRKAMEELQRYTPLAIRQLQAQKEAATTKDELAPLLSGALHRDASILHHLGHKPLSVSITPEQTPLDRVRAIRSSVDQVLGQIVRDERFHAAEKSADRTGVAALGTSLQTVASRFAARSEGVPAAREVERTR